MPYEKLLDLVDKLTQGIWLFGSTGTGKSHNAFMDYDPATCYVWKDDKGWQDGYCGQETVIINDFRGRNMPYEKLLDLVDKLTQGIWLFGSTGTGKSHNAFMDYDPATCYVWKDDKGWQDGYCGQETVIINDFRGRNMPYEKLLDLVDKYPTTVNRRGREPMPFTAKTVIITSSLTPNQIYNRRDSEDSLDQLLDRFTVVELKGESRRPKKKKPNKTVHSILEKTLKSGLGVIIRPSPSLLDKSKKSLLSECPDDFNIVRKDEIDKGCCLV